MDTNSEEAARGREQITQRLSSDRFVPAKSTGFSFVFVRVHSWFN